jgi:hypothetical protein
MKNKTTQLTIDHYFEEKYVHFFLSIKEENSCNEPGVQHMYNIWITTVLNTGLSLSIVRGLLFSEIFRFRLLKKLF